MEFFPLMRILLGQGLDRNKAGEKNQVSKKSFNNWANFIPLDCAFPASSFLGRIRPYVLAPSS